MFAPDLIISFLILSKPDDILFYLVFEIEFLISSSFMIVSIKVNVFVYLSFFKLGLIFLIFHQIYFLLNLNF